MKNLTTKQRGDAAEHYVIGMLGFAGIAAVKAPECCPGFDLLSILPNAPPQRVSVKYRNGSNDGGAIVRWWPADEFDWLAIVAGGPKIRTWIIPRGFVDRICSQGKDGYCWINAKKLVTVAKSWENNWTLKTDLEPKPEEAVWTQEYPFTAHRQPDGFTFDVWWWEKPIAVGDLVNRYEVQFRVLKIWNEGDTKHADVEILDEILGQPTGTTFDFPRGVSGDDRP